MAGSDGGNGRQGEVDARAKGTTDWSLNGVPLELLLDDQTIQRYDAPKGTVVVINAWAISRDPREIIDLLGLLSSGFADLGLASLASQN
ncbi:hypothetical protein EJB05_32872, partial [Eragrostis curvula]